MSAANLQRCQPGLPASGRCSFKWSLFLIGTILVGGLMVEWSARLLIPRMSKIEARVVREYEAAILPPMPRHPLVLFLGNSLMNAAVDFNRLKQRVGSEVDIRRFVVEGTGYWDWYYGIRRLYIDDARPDVIILMLGRHDIVSNTVRGDYFANRLMATRDIFSVASDVKLHPTVTANLLAANLSTFYGLRSEVRKVLLGKLMPDVPVLIHQLTMVRGGCITSEELASVGGERLKALNSLASQHHTRFIFILVPEPLSNEGMVKPLKQMAERVGVPLVLTFHNGGMLASEYSDGFHMNEQGAEKYTDSLVPEIRKLLDENRDITHVPSAGP
jgi:hypothetical protein